MGVGLLLVSLLMSLKQASGVTWGLVLPDALLGLRGSCVTVPCHFTVPNQLSHLLLNCSSGGIWRIQDINGPSVIGPDVRSPQGKITGDVRSRNCTTVFSGLSEERLHKFFFRLDCSPLLRFTYLPAAHISLERDLPTPQLSPVRPVPEGNRVRLQCSVPVPCPKLPPSIGWLPQDDFSQQQTRLQQEADGRLTLTSTLTFIATANHHNRSVTCATSYPLQNGTTLGPSTTTQVLAVLYAPRSTEAMLYRSGSRAQTLALVCSSDANPPVSIYSWYRVTSAEQLIRQGEGALLILTVPQSDSDEFLCEATNMVGSQRSRPVPLPASVTTGSSSSSALYALCGALFLLYVLVAAVNLHTYRSLSRRLKQVEAAKEPTYANLRQDAAVSDYDQIQQPKAVTSDSDYILPY